MPTDYKEETTKHKEKKRQPAPDKPVGKPKNKPKYTHKIQCRCTNESSIWFRWYGGDWYTWSKYRSLRGAEDSLMAARRNTHLEFRIVEI